MDPDQKVSTIFVSFIAGAGMFLSTLDSGIINVAIPSFIHIFNTNLDTVIWTVTLYTLILSATIMLFGKLADRYGRLNIYILGLVLFAISSLLCGFSPNIQSLISFRSLQGLGASMMQATAIAVITTKLARQEMTKAIGILGMLMGLGPALGPVVGGFILSFIGWRWMFWINIPICLFALYHCRQLKTKEVLHDQPINYLNLVLFGLFMMFLLLGMNYLPENIKFAIYLFLAMIIAFTLQIFIELKSTHPMLNYHLFKNIQFTAPMVGVVAMGSATAIVFILPPLFFEKFLHYDAWQVGLVNLSAPLGVILSSRMFMKISNKLGSLIPMLFSVGGMSLILLILTRLNINWHPDFIFALLFVYGFGGGLFTMACIFYLTNQFAIQEQAFVSSLIRMIQNAAIAFGAAGSIMLISLKSTVPSHANLLSGIQHAWYLGVATTALATLLLIIMYIKERGRKEPL